MVVNIDTRQSGVPRSVPAEPAQVRAVEHHKRFAAAFGWFSRADHLRILQKSELCGNRIFIVNHDFLPERREVPEKSQRRPDAVTVETQVRGDKERRVSLYETGQVIPGHP